MTDKEIIIDSVDVSECEFLWKERLPRKVCNNGNLDCDCNSNPNCHYKQLKRKEQALDEIEKQVKAMNNECFYDDICDCNNCDMKNGCSYYRKFKILNIINKVKEY